MHTMHTSTPANKCQDGSKERNRFDRLRLASDSILGISHLGMLMTGPDEQKERKEEMDREDRKGVRLSTLACRRESLLE
jgi:hypothetical protein